jgi:RimJ/RimL family protein N-acetyltransferase
MINTPTPTLQTERFTLRALGPRDVAPLFPTFADEAAMTWWSRGPFASEDELAAWLLDPTWGGRAWVPVAREGGAALGRFIAINRLDGVAEIGHLVVKDRQGEGIGRECLSTLLTHLFRAEGLRRIYADVDPDNAASNRLCERLGFTLEGRMRANWHTHIGVRDSLIWGLLQDEWAG